MNDFLAVMGEYLDNPIVQVTLARYAKESLFRWPVPPELNELARLVHEERPIADEARTRVAAALRRMPGENIEDVLSTETEIFEGKEGRFRFAINAIFATIGWNVHFGPLTNFLVKQLGIGSCKHTFLDFNYDLLLEHEVSEVCRNHSLPNWNPLSGYGFEAVEAGDNFRVFDSDLRGSGAGESTVQILKPHGSLNWVVPFKENYHFQDCSPSICLKDGQLAYSRDYEVCLQQALFIVAPRPQKDCSFGFIRRILEREQQAVNEADEIYVIGWSMPSTDLKQMNLIQDAVRENKPPQVTVVNLGANVDYFVRVADLFRVEPRSLKTFNGGFADFSDNLGTYKTQYN